MAARLNEREIPSPEDLSKLFSEATGDPETLDERDRLLLKIWEERVRGKLLARSGSPRTEPHRWRLPDERRSITHRFELPSPASAGEEVICPKCETRFHIPGGGANEFKGYLTMGVYEDGALGEIFLTMAKQGSFVSGIMDGFVTAISIGLQHGIPLELFGRKFKHMAFEPSGLVRGAPPSLRGFYKSLLDYLFRYLEWRFPDGRDRSHSKRAESTGAEASTEESASAASGTEDSIMTSAKEES